MNFNKKVGLLNACEESNFYIQTTLYLVKKEKINKKDCKRYTCASVSVVYKINGKTTYVFHSLRLFGESERGEKTRE